MPTGLPAGWRFLTDDEVRKVKAKKPDLDTRNIVINPELGVDSTYAEVVPEKQQGSANYFTQALRHGAASILPFAGARLGGKLLGLGATAVTANPLAGIGADIAGSVAAGMGTAAFQDAMAQKYADAHPDSVFAKQYRIIEADRKYSPLSSMILGGALASPVGGGGIGITKGMEGLKNAAKMGAAQAGVEAGIEGLHGEIDPASVFVAGLTGAISGRPSARWRRGERALLNQIPGAKNSAFVEYFAPEVVRDVPRYTPVDEVRSEYKRAITDNPESLLKSELWNPKMAMDRPGEELIALAGNVRKFRGLRAIGELKKQGVPLTEADFPEIIKLAEAKGVPAAVQTYKVLKSQMEGGYRAPDEAVQSKLTESQVLSEANARNIADLSRAQNAQAVQAAAESIVPPETPVKSAAESAEVMMARTAETKDIATQIKEIKTQERQVATLKEMWKIIPQEQRAQLDKLIDSLQENLIIRKLDLKRQGGENLLYGDQINEPNKTTIPGTEIPGEGIRPGETAAPVAGEIPGETTSITKPPPIPQKAGEGEVSIGGKLIKKKEVTDPTSAPGITLHSGLPENILQPVLDKFGKFARSGMSRLLKSGDPLLYRAAKRAEQAKNTYVKQAPYQADVTEARRLATSDDTEQVRKWLWYWRNGLDDKLPALSPHQEEIVRKLQDVVQTQGILKAMPGAPLVQEKSGEFRSVDPNVRFFPSMPSKEVIKVLKDARQNPNNEKFQEYKSDYLLHQMNRGSSAEEAMQNWKDFVGRHTTKFGSVNDPQLEFKGNRREMGESLPLSMQGSPFDALAHYIDRTHTDFAWHEFEKDPQVAKGLGLDHNGMGELIPDVVLDDAGKPIEHGSIAGNEDINAIFRDLSSSVSPSAQEFEKLQSIFLTGLVGTRSNIKDILFSPSRYAAVATIKDFMHLPRSWADMLSKEYTKKGLRTGAMRLHRNTAQTLDNTSDLISAIRDNYSFITGAEKVREIGMRGNVSFAENMAKNHVEDNDIPFLKKWGPIDYEKWDPLKLQDYITERLTAYFAGSQDFNELPNWQLRGSMNKATALAPLARWGSGAANRFVDLVIDPLKDGDARPLLKTLTAGLFTAAVYDELNEKLLGIKPKGLSFTEFFNLGGKDAVYTLLSKASAIGLAGIYSDVAFAIAQAAAGETPYGFSSPVMQFPANAFARYSQAIAAMENDGVEGLEAFGKATLALLQDQLQFVRDITTPPREDTGSREERLARHTGYLPPKVGLIPPIANPFSVANMYRTGDSDALARRFEIKRERRQEINPPQNPYRKERGTAAVGFQPDAYYLFLEDAQGKAAADAARERDMKKREENMQVFNDALMKMWR